MATGRPTKCNDEAVAKARYYLDNYSGKEFDDAVPQIASLAIYVGAARKTLYEWAKKDENEMFRNIFEEVKASQEKCLINGSLRNDLNPAISKMMLTKHDYSDKLETQNDHTSGGDKIEVITLEVIAPKNKDT